MELVVLFVAQLVVQQRVFHADQRLAHLLQVRVGAALGRVAGRRDFDGQHQFQDVLQVLVVAGRGRGNAERVLLEVRIDEDAAALLRRDQAFRLQARQRFTHDGAADRVGFGQLLFRGQAIAGRERPLAYLLRQRIAQRRGKRTLGRGARRILFLGRLHVNRWNLLAARKRAAYSVDRNIRVAATATAATDFTRCRCRR
ncbi:hypothetical protein D9M68_645270 [compost metagenome]